MRNALSTLVVGTAAAALLLSCSSEEDGDEPETDTATEEAPSEPEEPADDVSGTVTVMAAASLTDTFEDLAAELQAQYPDLEIVLSFGPSSGLAEQILAGAPADILATADTATMDTVVEGGEIDGEPQVFTRNMLVLAVPAGNPGDVTGLDDLADDDLQIALCEPQVPCGAASEGVLDAAGIEPAPDTLTSDVREALSLVVLGEVDATLVYSTDAASAGDDVEVIDDERTEAVINDYPVAVLSQAPNPEAAQVVFDAIVGEPGQTLLTEAGFIEP